MLRDCWLPVFSGLNWGEKKIYSMSVVYLMSETVHRAIIKLKFCVYMEIQQREEIEM